MRRSWVGFSGQRPTAEAVSMSVDSVQTPQALFANLQSSTVQNHASLFDFGGTTGVDIVDVQALFLEQQSSP